MCKYIAIDMEVCAELMPNQTNVSEIIFYDANDISCASYPVSLTASLKGYGTKMIYSR